MRDVAPEGDQAKNTADPRNLLTSIKAYLDELARDKKTNVVPPRTQNIRCLEYYGPVERFSKRRGLSQFPRTMTKPNQVAQDEYRSVASYLEEQSIDVSKSHDEARQNPQLPVAKETFWNEVKELGRSAYLVVGKLEDGDIKATLHDFYKRQNQKQVGGLTRDIKKLATADRNSMLTTYGVTVMVFFMEDSGWIYTYYDPMSKLLDALSTWLYRNPIFPAILHELYAGKLVDTKITYTLPRNGRRIHVEETLSMKFRMLAHFRMMYIMAFAFYGHLNLAVANNSTVGNFGEYATWAGEQLDAMFAEAEGRGMEEYEVPLLKWPVRSDLKRTHEISTTFHLSNMLSQAGHVEDGQQQHISANDEFQVADAEPLGVAVNPEIIRMAYQAREGGAA